MYIFGITLLTTTFDLKKLRIREDKFYQIITYTKNVLNTNRLPLSDVREVLHRLNRLENTYFLNEKVSCIGMAPIPSTILETFSLLGARLI